VRIVAEETADDFFSVVLFAVLIDCLSVFRIKCILSKAQHMNRRHAFHVFVFLPVVLFVAPRAIPDRQTFTVIEFVRSHA